MTNYANYNYLKEKYEEIRARVTKETGRKLKAKLKKENKTIALWITENAQKYLDE